MSLSNAAETAMLTLYFNNTNHANIGDATGLRSSSTAGSFYLSLHTADPGEAGNQSTSEISYTSYARVAVARSGSGWTISGNSATLASAVSFPASTGGTGGTVTHFGIGSDSSGTGNLLASGTVTPNIVVSSGVTPQLSTSTAVTAD